MQPIHTNNNGLLSIQTSRLHETLFEKEDSTPHMLKIQSAKITPDMYIGKVWQLKAHYGVLIWLLVFLLSFIIV